jgi:SAM-dependent methyltransferase
MSVVFKWKPGDFDDLVRSCDLDDATPYILKYMPREGPVLEAGCGLARFVKYLADKGFQNVIGVELSEETVGAVKRLAPQLDVRCADVSALPFDDNSMAGLISLGVVEHFVEGPGRPLREMLRVLKPRCYAVITVPCVNTIRKAKYSLSIYHLQHRLRALGRKVLRRKRSAGAGRDGARDSRRYKFRRWPILGPFLEYRFTRKEFLAELERAGFSVVESVPTCLIDGVYHEFGKAFVSFGNWKFYPNALGRAVNRALSAVPFSHNHMLLCVLTK